MHAKATLELLQFFSREGGGIRFCRAAEGPIGLRLEQRTLVGNPVGSTEAQQTETDTSGQHGRAGAAVAEAVRQEKTIC